MVISMMTNVAKIGENCDIEYAFSIGSEEFLPFVPLVKLDI